MNMPGQQLDAIATKTTVAIATASTGLVTHLQVVQSTLGIIASLVGIALTSILVYKEVKTLINKAKEHKRRHDDDREL
jgi:hypothetical protein